MKAAVLSETQQKEKEAHESMLVAAVLVVVESKPSDEFHKLIDGLELVNDQAIAILKATACAALSPTASSEMMLLASIYSIIAAFQDAAQPPC